MKLDTQVRLMGSLDLRKQGVADIEILTNLTGTVMDTDGSDVQVEFAFDEGTYHSITVWVDRSHVQE
jgi:hypothetical protein